MNVEDNRILNELRLMLSSIFKNMPTDLKQTIQHKLGDVNDNNRDK
jgi:hypothetical protein